MDPNKIHEMALEVAKRAIIAYVLPGKDDAFSRGFGNSASQKRTVEGVEKVLMQYLCQTAETTVEKAA
jgi:hypothetical protein